MIWKSQKSKRKEFETITRKVVEKHTQKCRDRQIRSMLNKKNILLSIESTTEGNEKNKKPSN